MPGQEEHPIFSLDEAKALLPRVKRVTANAVREAERLAERLKGVSADQPEHTALSEELQEVVKGWADELQSLGVEPKGLWLVDFDNGEGYYCWCYPEDGITHYHGYTDGFAGRMKIH